MDSKDSDNRLLGCFSTVRRAFLRRRKLSSSSRTVDSCSNQDSGPSGPGGPSTSSMGSCDNEASGPSGPGGLSSSSMGSCNNQTSGLLGRGSPSSSSMDPGNNQTSGPYSNPSRLDLDATTSSSSNRILSYTYDVFLSFRGTDTRNTFVDHLHYHLIGKGIFVFKDDQSLQKGDFISSQLVQAIRDSRLSIVVFSNDYASSSWCLDEMATIVECSKKFKQTVFPVFYHVDPSHVRNQNGAYENAFVAHTEKFKHEPAKVDRWKRAMTNLGTLVGWHVRDDDSESTIIQKIVQEVIKKLNHAFSLFTEDLVGIQFRVKELEKLLNLGLEDDNFRVLGICGMGGIGKTTHATVLYDRISYQFDACCFIENVSKVYRDGGAVAVQKQILRQTLNEQNLDNYSCPEISKIMINRLQGGMKVLVVLDNVDKLEQLQQLFKNPRLLGKGSRIVITTRDEHILRVYGADEIHKVSLLNDKEAHDLFCKRAFKSEEQSSSFAELIPEVLKYAQGLPLAIEVVGSSLCTRDASQWRDALDRFGKSPEKEITDVLEMSLEGLQFEEREIFLHIACFFKGERKDYVVRILDACALNPRFGIQRLIEKSLVTIRNEEIHMHEILQELGKKIVQHNCPEEPESWSRIWHNEDFHRAVIAEKGAIKVKAIVLNQKEDDFECKTQELSKFEHLKLLILYHKNFSGKLDILSDQLRLLLWHEYPLPTLPPEFKPYFLAELDLPYSNIRQLWEGCKRLRCLKRIDMSNSKYLIGTPDFEGVPELERLDFTGCTSLRDIHSSIGSLSKLVFLSFRNCANLEVLDFGRVSNLCSLRVLHLSGCTKLKFTPNFTGVFNLEYLDMDGCTSLSLVHESIEALTKLRFFSLKHCTSLVSMPNNINTMTSLITLDFCGCSKLENLNLEAAPSTFSMKSLIYMDLSFCDLYEVHDGIGELSCLERLNLQGNKFVSLPVTICKLSALAYLNLSHCHKLQSLPNLPSSSASKVGRYFTTTAGSRDHRSGLHIFDCPNVKEFNFIATVQFRWLRRLLQKPRHFRCGFDIIFPYHQQSTNPIIQDWLRYVFSGDSIIRVVSCVANNWIGFLFSVEFEAESPHQHSSSSPLPHPFYLSFEDESTEQRFDMPLNLDLDKIQSSRHIWTIYIAREHCHFIATGAHITFKACPSLVVKNWGIRKIVRGDIYTRDTFYHPRALSRTKEGFVIEKVEKSSNSSCGPKIQLPYNWLVTEGDEVDNLEAKVKEHNLSNLGL